MLIESVRGWLINIFECSEYQLARRMKICEIEENIFLYVDAGKETFSGW